MAEPLIVAIDGPSGVGKSTVARLLAERLGLPMLDTGAMYRAVALAVLDAGVDPEDRVAALRIAADAEIGVRPAAGGVLEVLLAGEPAGERLRSPEVTAASSRVSAYPEVRRRQVALQRRAAALAGAVVEGRDIGTVVFPDTPHKFFLTAAPEVRAERRFRELAAAGTATSREAVQAEIERRDERDLSRADSPLACNSSYTVVDTAGRSPGEVAAHLEQLIRGRGTAIRADRAADG